MEKIAVSLVLVLLAVLPAAAQARGTLDPSFGEGGRVVRESPTRTIIGRTQVVQAPSGTLYALYRGSLMAFRPNGETDSSFGTGGILSMQDRIPYEWGARLAIDSQGRPIVAGSIEVKENGYANPVLAEKLLAVTRLLPDGSPDPSFNGGEVLVSDLGLPEAEKPENAPDSIRGGVSLHVDGLAVDSLDRILVTGNRVKSYAISKNGLISLTEGVVGRLTSGGAVDRSYAGSGVARGFAPYGLAGSVMAADSSLYVRCILGYRRSGITIGGIARLTPEGFLARGFGGDGIREVPYDGETGMAVDGRGRLTVASSTTPDGVLETTLTKYRRDGSIATGFGRRGSLRLRFARSDGPSQISTDPRGGLFLATTLTRPRPGSGIRQAFALAHVSRDGSVDRSFGRIEIGFGANTKPELGSMTVDRRGRPLLAGDIDSPLLPGRIGLAMARYRPTGGR